MLFAMQYSPPILLCKCQRSALYAVAPVPATGPIFLRLESRHRGRYFCGTAERSAGTLWYNGNERRVVMVGALVRILAAVVFSFFFNLSFFLDKT